VNLLQRRNHNSHRARAHPETTVLRFPGDPLAQTHILLPRGMQHEAFFLRYITSICQPLPPHTFLKQHTQPKLPSQRLPNLPKAPYNAIPRLHPWTHPQRPAHKRKRLRAIRCLAVGIVGEDTRGLVDLVVPVEEPDGEVEQDCEAREEGAGPPCRGEEGEGRGLEDGELRGGVKRLCSVSE
jgi:hypothetical protein